EDANQASLTNFCGQLQENGFSRDNMVLALDSDTASLRYHGVPPVPSWRLDLILRYEIEEVAEKTGEQLSGGHIELQVPESASDDTLLLLGMGKDRLVQPLIDEVGSSGGRVRHALPAALGVYHSHLVTGSLRDDQTVILGDIGAHETQVLLVAGDRLLFARSIRFGFEQFIDSVVERCSVSRSEAVSMTESFIDGELVQSEDTVSQCHRGWLTQLSQLLGSSLNFCQAQLKIEAVNSELIRLSGAGAQLAACGGELKGSLATDVDVISISGLPDASWNLCACTGAAVLDTEERVVDLLPAEERKRKTFREKTVFLYGAMACFLLTLGVQFLDASIAGGRSEAARDDLRSWESKIQGWTQSEEVARKENDVLRKRESRLLEEVETSRFYARILDGLRADLPQEIAVDLVLLRRQSGEGALGIEIELQGRSDNSRRRGVDAIDELRDVLDSISGVKRVKADLQDLKGGSYPFQILVSPDEKMPEAGSRKRSRSGNSRSPFLRN
ncbi:MAG: hypothetical protein CBC13_00835, partial [Planctomycetia bacterium TMED53]